MLQLLLTMTSYEMEQLPLVLSCLIKSQNSSIIIIIIYSYSKSLECTVMNLVNLISNNRRQRSLIMIMADNDQGWYDIGIGMRFM